MAEVVTLSPPLSKLPIDIHGKKYHLCFEIGALFEAEEHFIRQGYDVDLYAILSSAVDLAGLLTVLACAMHRFHPELGLAEVRKLGTMKVLIVVGRAIAAAMAVEATREALCLRAIGRRLPGGLVDA